MTITKNSISKSERIILGCSAIAGMSPTEVASEHETNRQFVYDQKEKVLKAIENGLNVKSNPNETIIIDEAFLERTIISCSVTCKGSIRDIKEHLLQTLNVNVAEGKISRILNEAAVKAKKFNDDVDLTNIKVGAHDEIFQAGDPVLVGVDPHTTYVYLMEPSKNRDSISWSMAVYEKSENQGLKIDTTVTDGGTGMKKGIKEVFPDVNEQTDIFHAEMKMTKVLTYLERKAYAYINNEYELVKKFMEAKTDEKQIKHFSDYEKAITDTKKAIELYDKTYILLMWAREMFDMGGYSFKDRKQLLSYISNELNLLAGERKDVASMAAFIASNKDKLLYFVTESEKEIKSISLKENLSINGLKLLWKQKNYSEKSRRYWIYEGKIISVFGDKTAYAKEVFNKMVSKLVRASSIVECINSLIRPYLFLKRELKGKFLDLLQFYLNTRKYSDSRVTERKGKSPLQLLTGREYPCWLDLLGY